MSRADLALAVAALCFGTTFIVVQRSIEDLSPAAFIALRFAVGAAVVAPWAIGRLGSVWRPGIVLGLFLLAGYLLQTVGLQYTSSANSAFITGLFVVFTAVMSALVDRRLPRRGVLAAVALAAAGLFLLTGARIAVGQGDLLTLACAVAFAAHIVVLGRVAPRAPVLPLTAVQLAVVSAGAALVVPISGPGIVTAGAAGAAVTMGVVATAGAFGLMVYGQRRVEPVRAALLLALEPVFAGIVSVVSGERLGVRGWTGAALLLAAVLVVETGRGDDES